MVPQPDPVEFIERCVDEYAIQELVEFRSNSELSYAVHQIVNFTALQRIGFAGEETNEMSQKHVYEGNCVFNYQSTSLNYVDELLLDD